MLSQGLMLSFLLGYVICFKYCNAPLFSVDVTDYWCKSMGAKGTRLWLPKGGEPRRLCQSKRQRGWLTLSCSLRDRPSRRQIAPHYLMMLYEMFQHTVEQGWKEAEWTVCWGHQQELPKLDSKVDVSTIQLVGPQTNKKEIESLYLKCTNRGDYQVSTQRAGAIGGGDVFFEDCQGWKQKKAPEMAATVNRCQTPKEQNPLEGEERGLSGKKPA